MSNTKKHRGFVGGPIGDKLVTDLPGIGPVLGAQLNAKGIIYAYVVLAQYLLFGKDCASFVSWLKVMTAANDQQATDCCNCLKEWCNNFM